MMESVVHFFSSMWQWLSAIAHPYLHIMELTVLAALIILGLLVLLMPHKTAA